MIFFLHSSPDARPACPCLKCLASCSPALRAHSVRPRLLSLFMFVILKTGESTSKQRSPSGILKGAAYLASRRMHFGHANFTIFHNSRTSQSFTINLQRLLTITMPCVIHILMLPKEFRIKLISLLLEFMTPSELFMDLHSIFEDKSIRNIQDENLLKWKASLCLATADLIKTFDK